MLRLLSRLWYVNVPQPTSLGKAYLLTLLVPLTAGALVSRDPHLYLLLAFGLGFALVCLAASWLNLKDIGVRRALPREIHAGETVRVGMTFMGRRSWFGSFGIDVIDQFRRQYAASECFSYLPRLASGSETTASYRTRFRQRGRYRLEVTRLSSSFPFGLFRCVAFVRVPSDLVVYPALGELVRVPGPAGSGLSPIRRAVRQDAAQIDPSGLREYRDGDPTSWIHFKASARHQRLLVRLLEPEQSRDVLVFLNGYVGAFGDLGTLRLFEQAVSAAATICVRLLEADRTVRLAHPTPGPIREITGARNLGGSAPLLEALSEVSFARGSLTMNELAPTLRPGEEGAVVVTPRAHLCPPPDPGGSFEVLAMDDPCLAGFFRCPA